MATTTLNSRLLMCTKTTAAWESVTTVPLRGELCVEITDDNNIPKFKVGNGTDVYEDLPYATMTASEIQNLITTSAFDLNPATTSLLGGVIIGVNIEVDSTGKISIKEASTSQKGVVQLSSAIDSTSTTQAATPSAVKQAYDKAKDAKDAVDGLKAIASSGEAKDVTVADTANYYTGTTVEAVLAEIGAAINGGSVADQIKAAIEALDSSTAADSGSVLTGITITDGKITAKTQQALAGVAISGTASDVAITDSGNKTTQTNVEDALQELYTKASDLATADTTKMPIAGGAFTGEVTLNADPTADLGAATKQYVDNQITTKLATADAMVFKGTLGTGGTVTSVPTSNVVEGDTYKIITAGSYAGYSGCKVGDLLIALNSGSLTANTTNWAYVPSGDETVTTIKYSTSTQSLTTSAQSGAITVGEAATKQVDTSISASSSSTKLPTSKAVADFVEGKGYKTTDENVKSTPSSSQNKVYITGTTSSSESTGTQVFDTDIYLDTTNGTVHATKFEGALTGTASKANELATSRNISIKGGATAAAVSFNGSANVELDVTAVNTNVLTQTAGDILIIDGNFS